MLRKQFTGVIAGLALSLGSATAQDANNQILDIDIAYSADSFAYIPFFMAESLGYFKDVGINVNLQKTGSGSKALAAVIGGNADVYIGSNPRVINAQQQGIDVVAFVPITTQYTTSVTVSEKWAKEMNVTADSPIEEKFNALRGIRVGITGPGSGTDDIIRYLAKESGLDPERDMSIVGIGSTPASHLAAMKQDQVDGIVFSPPLPQVAEKEQNAVILFNNAIGEVEALDGFFYIGAIARRDWLAENPETAIRFAAGIQLALDGLRVPEISQEGEKEVGETFFPSLEKDVLSRVWSDIDKSVPESVVITRQMLEQVIEFENASGEEYLDPSTADKYFVSEYGAKGAEMATTFQQK